MGFIKAFSGAIGGTFADQWKDFFVPIENISSTSVVYRAELNIGNVKRNSNIKGSENILTNGSKIIVPEGSALITMQDGAITSCITEPGGFIYSSDNQNSKSFFMGDSFLSTTLKTSWDRFKFGGNPSSEQMAFYVNLKEIPGNRFGTQSDIYWNDSYLHAQVGAKTRGMYSIQIVDPILFIKNFVPSTYLRPNSDAFNLEYNKDSAGEQLFSEVVGCLSSAFSNYMNNMDKENNMTKIQSDQIGFAKSLSAAVEDAYKWKSDRGIEIVKVAITAIEYDEETKKLLSDVNKAEALNGNRGNSFMKQAVARGFQDAGSSSNGGANIAFMGLGMNSINEIIENKTKKLNEETNREDLYETLKQLKKLFDEEIITKEEFETAKKKILDI